MRQSDITRLCRFSKAKTSQLLAALEKKGDITRYKKGRDKIVNLTKTGKGEKAMKNQQNCLKNIGYFSFLVIFVLLYWRCFCPVRYSNECTNILYAASVGSTLTVAIKISNVQNLAGIDTTLTWNPAVLDCKISVLNLGVENLTPTASSMVAT